MTDLEITRLCAEAFGLTVRSFQPTNFCVYVECDVICMSGEYNPLHDDAQAMALVKKFQLGITSNSVRWLVNDRSTVFQSSDLNRAICECVAKMQEAKCRTK